MVEKKNYENMRDDTWKQKGHAHPTKRSLPAVCPMCNGTGTIEDFDCPLCEGEGVVYE